MPRQGKESGIGFTGGCSFAGFSLGFKGCHGFCTQSNSGAGPEELETFPRMIDARTSPFQGWTEYFLISRNISVMGPNHPNHHTAAKRPIDNTTSNNNFISLTSFLSQESEEETPKKPASLKL